MFFFCIEAVQIELAIEKLSQDPKFSDVTFKFVIEDNAMGTGGAILHAIDRLSIHDSFLVANADTWLSGGVQALCIKPPCAIAAVKVSNTDRYGSLGFSENKISFFEEKSGSIGEGYVNSGLYHLDPSIFDDFNAGDKFSLGKSYFS